jgi:hypothetical protein
LRVLAVVHSPRAAAFAHLGAAVRAPDHAGEEGDQAEAVEGGVVAGDRQAQAARPGDHPERRVGGQVEAVDQGGSG